MGARDMRTAEISVKPKTIAEYGSPRNKIRVFEDTVGGERLVRVRWRDSGLRRTRSWPNNAQGKQQAKAYAKGLSEGRDMPSSTAPLSLRDMWDIQDIQASDEAACFGSVR